MKVFQQKLCFAEGTFEGQYFPSGSSGMFMSLLSNDNVCTDWGGRAKRRSLTGLAPSRRARPLSLSGICGSRVRYPDEDFLDNEFATRLPCNSACDFHLSDVKKRIVAPSRDLQSLLKTTNSGSVV